MKSATEVWRHLLNEGALPTTIAQAARDAFVLLDRTEDAFLKATDEYDQAVKRHADARLSAPKTLIDQLSNNDKPTHLTVAAETIKLDQRKTIAAEVRAITRAAHNTARHQLEHDLINTHRHELLAWLVERRCLDVGTFGDVDPVTKHQVALYDHVRPYVDRWPDDFDMPPTWHFLPIINDPRTPLDFRRKVAWCWQELAAGRYRRQNNGRIRFTHQPNEPNPLPIVPDAPQDKQTPRLMFGGKR
jgi:hypothetical protein